MRPLIKALRTDINSRVRAAAARSLGLLHAVEARDALMAALNDSDEYVRSEAKEALKAIK